MSDSLAEAFIAALNADDAAAFEPILDDDCGLRAWRADGRHEARPRDRVVRWLQEERAAWHEARFELLTSMREGDRASIEFNIQVTDADGRAQDHARAATLELDGGKITAIHLYCTEPVPGAVRDRVAPADVSPAQRDALLRGFNRAFDSRYPISHNQDSVSSVVLRRFSVRQQHPGTNTVMDVRWSDIDVDARIAEMIEWHRAQDIGFQWIVGPWDTPADLGARLERHGFARAGDQALMVRFGLGEFDIPTNPALTIEELDGSDDDAIEASLRITGVAFKWPREQVDAERAGWFSGIKERLHSHHYLARLEGVPVAEAHLYFKAGVAYLGGASTLPEHRNQKIYSSLLRRRLETARDAGYNVAAIIAEPMSRRVVARYGFAPHAMFDVYAWMPVMDPAVIATLVQDD